MSKQLQDYKADSKLQPSLEFESSTDAAGLWFAAAAVFAVLAAGVIVYRAASPEIQTAANGPAITATHPTR
jgi:hypothetical protein